MVLRANTGILPLHGDYFNAVLVWNYSRGIPLSVRGLPFYVEKSAAFIGNTPVLYGDCGTDGASSKLISGIPPVCTWTALDGE